MIGRPAEAIADHDLNSVILLRDRVVFVAGLTNCWARRRKLKLADLLGEPWSLPPSGSIPRSALDGAFRAAGLEISTVNRLNPGHPSAHAAYRKWTFPLGIAGIRGLF